MDQRVAAYRVWPLLEYLPCSGKRGKKDTLAESSQEDQREGQRLPGGQQAGPEGCELGHGQ